MDLPSFLPGSLSQPPAALSLNDIVFIGVADLGLAVAGGLLLGYLDKSGAFGRWLGFRPRHPQAWDWAFGRDRHMSVIVTLTDGSRLAGVFSSGSIAASFPNEADLYLESLFDETEQGYVATPNSAGAWIPR